MQHKGRQSPPRLAYSQLLHHLEFSHHIQWRKRVNKDQRHFFTAFPQNISSMLRTLHSNNEIMAEERPSLHEMKSKRSILHPTTDHPLASYSLKSLFTKVSEREWSNHPLNSWMTWKRKESVFYDSYLTLLLFCPFLFLVLLNAMASQRDFFQLDREYECEKGVDWWMDGWMEKEGEERGGGGWKDRSDRADTYIKWKWILERMVLRLVYLVFLLG